ncbi:S1/P1 nuclease [Aliidiomarina maris]|nr:S1/P1 nuclease [Aliidiomarina maris]RAJ96923.1 S1/P1 nuclease [Aliidiomarina maris]
MHKVVNCKASLTLGIGLFAIGAQLSSIQDAHAWGFAGHEFIGHTTYAYLTPEARAWVDSKLAYLEEESLATATTWADRVRGTEEGWALGPLHFANIPPHATEIDMQRDCPNRRCVVGATFDALDVLLDPTADPSEQADQLRKITHWITDMHQPLHLGFARDRGGNDTIVEFNGEEQNLHRTWDTLILVEKDLPTPEQFAAEQALPDDPQDWYEAVKSWATEANMLAREYAYGGMQEGEPLSDAYVEQARVVIRQQLHHSAQRMAQVINYAAEINLSAE